MAGHVGSTSKEEHLLDSLHSHWEYNSLYIVHATVLHMSSCVCFILVLWAL